MARSKPFKLYRLKEVMELPDPTWLIEGVLEAGSLAMLYGPSGEGKSFLAIDWTMRVATGRQWVGREVKQGRVIYVAAEGGRGIKKRISAWLRHHGAEMNDDVFVLLEPVQMKDPEDVKALVSQIESLNVMPTLIVLDTFARCFVGGDENQVKDAGLFIDAAQRLQVEANPGRCTVLIVHHTGKDRGEERGSSSLRAAMESMIKLWRDATGAIRVSNEKLKDEEEFKPLTFALKRISLGTSPEGKELTSCVLEPTTGESKPARSRLSESELRALRVLAKFDAMKSGAWREAAEADGGGSPISPVGSQNVGTLS